MRLFTILKANLIIKEFFIINYILLPIVYK